MSTTEAILKDMLADRAAVRTWLAKEGRAVADAAAAKLYIHQEGLPAPAARGIHTIAELVGYRPYILIWETAYRVSRTSNTGWLAGGEAVLAFFQDVPTALVNDPAGASKAFRDTMKDLLADLAEASQVTAGYLAIESYGIEEGPFLVEPEDEHEQGLHQWCACSVRFGDGED
jgi:hypothetical protein